MAKKKASSKVLNGKVVREPKGLKVPTKEELLDLYYAVDNEGFGYYMLDYGPDLDLIERMGFDREELNEAISLFGRLQDAIQEIERSEDEEE